ncbi:MAG: ATP-binding protein [Alphaproteobacteria bacterium]|nr:ATP-binding protein [Alphaproteobacteria bacterium]MCB9794947.1 ATP-binding protein [Alphaproteobacteria bacterium]
MSWSARNHAALMLAVGAVKQQLRAAREGVTPPPHAPLALEDDSALAQLSRTFGLDDFERATLTLCVGVELDPELAELCGAPGPSFGLALSSLPGAHWSAAGPAAPLRRWSLLELVGDHSPARCLLRVDERVFQHLLGVQYLDTALEGLLQPLSPPPAAGAEATLEQLRVALEAHAGLVCLSGPEGSGAEALAAAALLAAGARPWRLPARGLPRELSAQAQLARRLDRESALSGLGLVLVLPEEPEALRAARDFAQGLSAPVVLVGARPPSGGHTLHVRLSRPDPEAQALLWAQALPEAPVLGAELAARYRLFPAELASAAAQARVGPAEQPLEARVREACRALHRPHLDPLAERVALRADWDDLVLPGPQRESLRRLAAQVRQRHQVLHGWGFARRGQRGLGCAALFAGPSGTGKTLAAEVLARSLDLDLYRIDLSRVVSKYIGETEKNLARIFDAAEGGGALLLFDEADAMFGKRTEVRDSHDRYANLEVSYLLQRMESFEGLAILTSNMKNAMDTAFLRRLRFIVQFPFPGPADRAEIWRRALPPELPTEGLQVESLARLSVSGGHIRNIALEGAFLAAEEESPLTMDHLLRAARAEFAKLERPLPPEEVASWRGAGRPE